MRVLSILGTLLVATTQVVAGKNFDSAEDRAAAVQQAFQLSWDAYYEHAFPHDQLKPVSQGTDDS
jgi:mannosyl-oligosaccharide alpha-1,2-mannosidase